MGTPTKGLYALIKDGADTIALQRGAAFNITTDMIDTTTKDDTLWKQFLPGFSEGEVTCDALMDLTGTTQTSLVTHQANGTTITLKQTLNSAGTAYLQATCYVTNLKFEGAHDGVNTFSATFKPTGTVSLTTP
jgi:TP901-1 family phage major tail protein